MKTYQSILQHINWVAFLIVIFLLPAPQIFLRYACILWVVSWLLEGRWVQRACWHWSKQNIPFLLFALWYLWGGVSILWSPDPSLACQELLRLLGIPFFFLVSMCGVNHHYQIAPFRRILVYSCLASVAIYSTLLIIKMGGVWNFDYFSDQLSYYKHRLFLCSVETAGMIAACARHHDLKAQYGKRWAYLIIGIEVSILFIFILLSGSRASLLTLIVLGGIGLIHYVPRHFRWYAILSSLLIGCAMVLLALQFHPRMQSFSFSQLTSEQLTTNREPRLNIWQMALEQPSDYAVYGLGLGQSTPYLVKLYQKYHFKYYIVRGYCTHNQYLNEWMDLGIIGLILFLIGWFCIGYYAPKAAHLYAVFFIVVFGLNMFTENIIGRFDGIALWCVWMLAVFLIPHSSAQLETKSIK